MSDNWFYEGFINEIKNITRPGSGGSVPKPLTYDYMPEGYPSKSAQNTILMAEQGVAFSDAGRVGVAAPPVVFELTEGETYTVVWDGVEYKCVCYTNGHFLYIGNPAAFRLEATSEPFLYGKDGEWVWLSYDSTENHTISVSGNIAEYKKIDTNFLPESTVTYIGDPSEWSDDKKQQMYYDFLAGKVVLYRYSSDSIGVVLNVYYYKTVGIQFVVFENYESLLSYYGAEFKRCYISEDGINYMIRSFYKSTTYWPLRIPTDEESVGDTLDAGLRWNPNTQRPTIYENVKLGNGLTEYRYSDIVVNGDTELVLASSTEGSTKKFKITVDDTGTLSATEVT